MTNLLKSTCGAVFVAIIAGGACSTQSLAARVVLESASGGVYTYDILLGSNELFDYGSIDITGLSGVTGASVAGRKSGLRWVFRSSSLANQVKA